VSELKQFHINIRLSGRVQGVGFRYNARLEAVRLGIAGFVRNLPGGDVYIEAEGHQAAVNEFLAWCTEGPPRSRVDHADITEGMVAGYREFVIK
jgi:acylphosphatase